MNKGIKGPSHERRRLETKVTLTGYCLVYYKHITNNKYKHKTQFFENKNTICHFFLRYKNIY